MPFSNICDSSTQSIYAHLKRTLGKIVDRDASEIYAMHDLTRAPLSFSPAGKRALARHLNEAFGEQLAITRDETGAATTVRDLYVLISKRRDEVCA